MHSIGDEKKTRAKRVNLENGLTAIKAKHRANPDKVGKCIFCDLDVPKNIQGKKAELCGGDECFRKWNNAYQVDYRQEIFQQPLYKDLKRRRK